LSYQWYSGSIAEQNKVGSNSNTLSVTNVSDSGTYNCVISITSDDVTKTATAQVNVSISKKTINVTADAKTIVAGSANVALTYTADSLYGDDTFNGALARDAGDTPGQYDITIGTLTAGDNYSIVFNDAIYTIKNASITSSSGTDGSSIEGSIGNENGFSSDNEFEIDLLTEAATLTAPKGTTIFAVYNAQLSGTTPSGVSTITFAAPAELADATECQILVIENGEQVVKTATISNGFITFETSGIGEFAIITNNGGLNGFAIAGIVIGCIALLGCAAVAVWFITQETAGPRDSSTLSE
jgi:hypothetical protein